MRPKLLRQCLRYFHKVYDLSSLVKGMRDFRRWHRVPAQTIFLSVFFLFLLRLPSFNRLEKELQRRPLQRLIPPALGPLPSADTLGYALECFDWEPLERALVGVNRQLKRNKVYRSGSLKGWLVAAMDGVELFHSQSRCCGQCLTRQVTKEVAGQKVKVPEYYHRAVVCQLVGVKPQAILGLELWQPEEGEFTVAQRLFSRLIGWYGCYFQVLVVDALYAKAPFINLVVGAGMHIVVRLKDERLAVLKDAQGLFDHRPADLVYVEAGGKVKYWVWDEGGFESWAGVAKPLRVVKLVEQKRTRVRRGKQWKEAVEYREIWLATSLGPAELSGLEVGKIYHWRWEIENNGFRDLKTNWHLDHAFVHQPRALYALLLVLALVFTLFYAFVYRNLRRFWEKGWSVAWVVREFSESYFTMRGAVYRVYWDTS